MSIDSLRAEDRGFKRIDPLTNEVTATAYVADGAWAMIGNDTSLWCVSYGSLLRIDVTPAGS